MAFPAKKRQFTVRAILFVSAVMTGLLANVAFLPLLLIAGFFISMSLIVSVWQLGILKKPETITGIGKIVVFFFLTALLTSYISGNISERKATRLSDEVIAALQRYKVEHGYFPQNIQALPLTDETEATFQQSQQYIPDSTLQQFKILGHMDGWHRKVFYSEEPNWRWED